MQARTIGSATFIVMTFASGAISHSAAETLAAHELADIHTFVASHTHQSNIPLAFPPAPLDCVDSDAWQGCLTEAYWQVGDTTEPHDQGAVPEAEFEHSTETSSARSFLSRLVVTPRISIYFDNSNDRESVSASGVALSDPSSVAALQDEYRAMFGPSSTFTQVITSAGNRAPQLAFEMYGGSVGYDFSDDATQLVVTALIGETDSTSETIIAARNRLSVGALAAEDVQFTPAVTYNQIERTDLELTLQRRLNETFAVLGGFRYEGLDTEVAVSGFSRTSANITNFTNFLLSSGAVPLTTIGSSAIAIEGATESRLEMFSVRAGMSGYAGFGQRHLAYVSGMAQLAHTPESRVRGEIVASSLLIPGLSETVVVDDELPSETLLGPDITVGYQYRISDRLALDARYRFQSYYPLAGPASFDDLRVNHGFMLGVSAWLGATTGEVGGAEFERARSPNCALYSPRCATPQDAGGWEFAFTPRAAYYFDNIAQLEDRSNDQSVVRAPSQTELDALALLFGEPVSLDAAVMGTSSAAPQIAWPLYGAAMTLGRRGGAVQYTLTALAGDASISQLDVSVGTIDLNIANLTAEDLFAIERRYVQDLSRLDIEFTAQWRLSDATALLAGARFEQMQGDYTGETRAVQSLMSENLVSGLSGSTPLPGGFHYGLTEYGFSSSGEQELENYSVRLGLAGFARLGDRQRVYVNGFAHASYSPEAITWFDNVDLNNDPIPATRIIKPEEIAVGPDVTVGYQFQLTENVSFDARYRAVGYFSVSGQRDADDPRVGHGLSIGLSVWFGS